MTSALDVLAIAAHPDDAEVGCGGTLILAASAGLRVGVADLTEGDRATRGTPQRRSAERDRASQLLGLAVRTSLRLPDAGLGLHPSHRDALIDLIRGMRPAVLLAPYPQDRHPDHAAAGTLAREASFLAGVARVGQGPPHRPSHVFHYMVNQPFVPSFVVDVSGVWDQKMEAVRSYESQFGHHADEPPTELAEGRLLRVVEANGVFHGAMVGADHGEPFSCPGPVPLRFLPGFHDAGPGTVRGYRSFL